NPRNYGNMEKPTVKLKDSNPYCGDELEFFLKIEEGIIVDVKFRGTGCAISQASASMLSEELIGMKIRDVMRLGNGYVQKLIGTTLTPTRLKCALLPLMVAKAAIAEFEEKKQKK
ncbi:MAG: iron-sulfur cluster assembly scaffold protein, partial [Candidatus Micrarchaeota archaeon]